MPARLITWASTSARAPEIRIVLLGDRVIRVASNPDNSGTKPLVGRDGHENSDFGRVVNLGTIEGEHHDEGLRLMDALCHTHHNGCGTKRRSTGSSECGKGGLDFFDRNQEALAAGSNVIGLEVLPLLLPPAIEEELGLSSLIHFALARAEKIRWPPPRVISLHRAARG